MSNTRKSHKDPEVSINVVLSYLNLSNSGEKGSVVGKLNQTGYQSSVGNMSKTTISMTC